MEDSVTLIIERWDREGIVPADVLGSIILSRLSGFVRGSVDT